jgi:hypothetical protein
VAAAAHTGGQRRADAALFGGELHICEAD